MDIPALAGGDTSNPDDQPLVGYWHLWTDEQGISHQVRCALSNFHLKGVGGAAPQWNDQQPNSKATVVFTVQPVGWVGEWHENPAPQWIVPLSGRWFVEAMDGTRIEMGPGEFSLGEDQNCVETGGKKGHRSGTLGNEPAVLMTVQLHVQPVGKACHCE
jgi:hypothetical protein